MPNLDPNPYYNYEFVLDDDEIYYHFELLDSSFISRLVLSSNGIVQRFTWIDRTQGWTLYLTVPIDNCDTYALCGAYGSCKDDSFESGDNSKCQKEDLELRVFDLGTVAIATSNFSEENKLGEGGFGPVYKAWRLFTEDRSIELLDELVESYNTAEVLRSIHIALLCVQQCPEERPSMSLVILMLGSDNELPLPKEPGMKHPTCFMLFSKMANDVFVAKHYSRSLLSLQMRGHYLQ
ncbi:hypothetical protein NL676_027270 [Syzygium grande]|nr:hypothetical protein NL676_027270 [Syzygium grande]